MADMRTELAFMSIAEAGRLIAARKLSPVEYTDAPLQRIAAFDLQLNAFITVRQTREEPKTRSRRGAIAGCCTASRSR